jgi:hypothetical protein
MPSLCGVIADDAAVPPSQIGHQAVGVLPTWFYGKVTVRRDDGRGRPSLDGGKTPLKMAAMGRRGLGGTAFRWVIFLVRHDGG